MPSGYTTITHKSNFLTSQANTTSEMTEILDVQTPAGKRFMYPPDRGIEMFLMTHEQFTTDGTGANQETFSLSNELVDSPALAGDSGTNGTDSSPPGSGQADLVLYNDGTQVAPDVVRYNDEASNPNEFDYTDSGTGSTLDVYYVWGDSSLIEGRYYKANEEGYDQVFGTTGGELHTVKTFDREEMLTFDNPFTAGPKERFKVFVNTAVDLTNWDASGNLTTGSGGGPNSTTSYATFRFPVKIQDAPNRRNVRSVR